MADSKVGVKFEANFEDLKKVKSELLRIQSELSSKAGSYSTKYPSQSEMMRLGSQKIEREHISPRVGQIRGNIDTIKGEVSEMQRQYVERKSAFSAFSESQKGPVSKDTINQYKSAQSQSLKDISSRQSSITSSQGELRELLNIQKEARENLKRLVDQGKFEAQERIAEDRQDARRETSEFFSMSRGEQGNFLKRLGGDEDLQRRRLEYQRDYFDQEKRGQGKGLINTAATLAVLDQALRKVSGAYSGAQNGLEIISPVFGGVGAGIGYAVGGSIGARIGQVALEGVGEMTQRVIETRDAVQQERFKNRALSGTEVYVGGAGFNDVTRKSRLLLNQKTGQQYRLHQSTRSEMFNSEMSEYGLNPQESAQMQRAVMLNSLRVDDSTVGSTYGYAQGTRGLGLEGSQMDAMMRSMRMRRSSGNLQQEILGSFNRFANSGFGDSRNSIGFSNYLQAQGGVNEMLSTSVDRANQGRVGGILGMMSRVGGAFSPTDPRFSQTMQNLQTGLTSGDQYSQVAQYSTLAGIYGKDKSLFELEEKRSQGVYSPKYLKGIVDRSKRTSYSDEDNMLALMNMLPGLAPKDIRKLYNASSDLEVKQISDSYTGGKGITADQLSARAKANTTDLQTNQSQIFEAFELGMTASINKITSVFVESMKKAIETSIGSPYSKYGYKGN